MGCETHYEVLMYYCILNLSISVYDYLRAVINVVGVMTTYWYSWHRYSNVHLAICQMHSGFPILNQCDI